MLEANEQASRANVEAVDRRINAIRERATRCGWTTHVVGSGLLLFCRWGRSVEVTLDAAEAMLEREETREPS